MKKTALSLFIALSVLVTNSAPLTTQDIIENIATLLKYGKTEELADYFSNNVELSILENEETYSKAQAKIVIGDFFDKHKPSGFNVLHQGKSKIGLEYAIGTLSTDKGTFRVTVYIKNNNDKFQIQQLRIDEEGE